MSTTPAHVLEILNNIPVGWSFQRSAVHALSLIEDGSPEGIVFAVYTRDPDEQRPRVFLVQVRDEAVLLQNKGDIPFGCEELGRFAKKLEALATWAATLDEALFN